MVLWYSLENGIFFNISLFSHIVTSAFRLHYRDQFYELLRDWEENHLTSGWSLQESLGDRIRSLVSTKIDFANHVHFSRLFLSQLIQVSVEHTFIA